MKEVVLLPLFGNKENEVQGSSPRTPKFYGQDLKIESILLITQCFRVYQLILCLFCHLCIVMSSIKRIVSSIIIIL